MDMINEEIDKLVDEIFLLRMKIIILLQQKTDIVIIFQLFG